MKLRISISFCLLLLFLTLAIPTMAAEHELTITVPVTHKTVVNEKVRISLEGLNESEHDQEMIIDGSGTREFYLTFHEAGTYWYIMSLISGDTEGVHYDETKYQVIITIAESVDARVMKGDVVVAKLGELNKATSVSFEDSWEDDFDKGRDKNPTPTVTPSASNEEPTRRPTDPSDHTDGENEVTPSGTNNGRSNPTPQKSTSPNDGKGKQDGSTNAGSILGKLIPKTGDAAPIIKLISVMALSLLCIFMILVKRRERQHEEN